MLSNITYLFVLIVDKYIYEYILLISLIILSFVKLGYHHKRKYIVENKFFILYLILSMFVDHSLILCTLIVVLVFDEGDVLCHDKELM